MGEETKRARMKLSVRPALLIYLAALALLASPQALAGAALALAVHECGHIFCAQLLGERFERLELTPFGGLLSRAAGESMPKGLRGALLAAAGPAANYAALLALAAAGQRGLLCGEILRQALLANAVMLVFNLAPALPLDGGRVAYAALSGTIGVSHALSLLTAMGALLGASLVFASAFGFARLGILNLSALTVGAYLLALAPRERSALLSSDAYAALHERSVRPERVRRLTLYEAPASAPLFALLEPLEASDAAAFVVRGEDAAYIASEAAVRCALLGDLHESVGEFAEREGQKLGMRTKKAPDS